MLVLNQLDGEFISCLPLSASYSPLYSTTLHVFCTVGCRHVVELGSGLGLVGISSLLLFPLTSFTFTDCHPRVLEALRENLQLQSGCPSSIRCSPSLYYVRTCSTHWCQTHKPLHSVCIICNVAQNSGLRSVLICNGVVWYFIRTGALMSCACLLPLVTSCVLLQCAVLSVCAVTFVSCCDMVVSFMCVSLCNYKGDYFKCSNYSVEELDWLSCSDKEPHPVLSQTCDLVLASGKTV